MELIIKGTEIDDLNNSFCIKYDKEGPTWPCEYFA